MTDAAKYDSPPGLRSSLRNGSFLALSKLYYLAVRGAYIVFFARIIGVEAYGYYSYAQNWYVLFLPLAMWGMNELVISELSKTPPEKRAALLGSGLALRVLLSIVFVLLIMVAAALLEPDSQLRLLICIYTQGLFARAIANWYSALFVAVGKSENWLYVSVPFMTLEIVLALVLASRGASLIEIAWMQSILWWLMMFCSCWLYRVRMGKTALALSPAYLRFYLSKGVSLASATFLMFCLTPGLLILYRNFAGDIQRIGEVALVLQVIMILDQIIMVVSNAALPALNRSSADASVTIRAFCRMVWLGALYAGGALAVACTLLIPVVIGILPANMFSSAALLFADTSWLLVPLIALHGFRIALIASGRMHSLLLTMLLGVLVLLVLVWWFAGLGQLDAASLFLALGISMGIIAATMLLILVREG